MSEHLDHLVEVMLDGNEDDLSKLLLVESEKDEVTHALEGETTLLNYLLLFEQYLENHDLYLFRGWEDAEVIQKPRVEKFWVVFWLKVTEKTDLRGARRIRDAEDQTEVKRKRLADGSSLIRFSILKRALDQIETDNLAQIDKISDESVGV